MFKLLQVRWGTGPGVLLVAPRAVAVQVQVQLIFRMPTSSLTVVVPPTHTMAQVKAEIEVR